VKESKLTRWHLKRHTAFTVSLFSLSLYLFLYIHCWYLNIVADKRNVVIFACHSGIYHFIRQFYKKPAGYMCYTFLFSSSSSTKILFVFLSILFKLLIYRQLRRYLYVDFLSWSNVKITLVLKINVLWRRRHVLKTSMYQSLLINKRKMSCFFFSTVFFV